MNARPARLRTLPALQSQLTELHTLIVNDNVDAAVKTEELARLLRNSRYDGQPSGVLTAVGSYEFDQALELLKQLAVDLGFKLPIISSSE